MVRVQTNAPHDGCTRLDPLEDTETLRFGDEFLARLTVAPVSIR